ncbi:MAG: SGNH/GDSL hydrolase family protein [Planctomycetota bacterium]|jgi:hypothetical protein
MAAPRPDHDPPAARRSPRPAPLRVKLVAMGLVALVCIGIDWTGGFILYQLGDYELRPGRVGAGTGIRVPSDQYHHGLRPATRASVHWGPLEYELVTNALGLTDAGEREIASRHDGRRILFVGDSYTEGVGYPWGQTWVGLIAERLAPRGVEVLNAAVVSYCPKLSYYKVRDLVEQVGLEIDELVVFIDVSDTPDELLYNDFVPVDPDPEDTWSGRFEIAPARPALPEYSLIYRTVRRMADRDPWDALRFTDRDTGERFDFTNERDGWTRSPRMRREWGDHGLASAAFYVDRLLALCERHGIEMAIGINPWPDDVRLRALDSPYRRFWLDFAADRGIRIDDLFPAFIPDDAAERARIADTEFIPDDMHVNEAGHRRFAEAWLAMRGES